MTTTINELKAKILELLEKDEEFRYAVAGKIGLLEILKRLDRIEEEIRKLWEKSLEHDKKFKEMNKRLSRIELELGALNEAFYSKALWDDLREEIRENNEKVIRRERNARIDEEDIDYLIVTNRKVYVVEVKVKPRHQDIGRLIVKADLVRKHYPDKQVVPILAGTMIGREIEEYAKEKKIRVYKL